MLTQLRPAISLTVLFTLLTGLAYPLAMTGIAQAVFPASANGSLIRHDDTVIGSSLIAQPFTGAAYLHPRPSASGWNAAGTGASNLGPTSAALIAAVAERPQRPYVAPRADTVVRCQPRGRRIRRRIVDRRFESKPDRGLRQHLRQLPAAQDTDPHSRPSAIIAACTIN